MTVYYSCGCMFAVCGYINHKIIKLGSRNEHYRQIKA